MSFKDDYFLILIFVLFSMFSTACSLAAEIIAVDGQLARYDNGIVTDTESTLAWYAGPDEGVSWEDASRAILGTFLGFSDLSSYKNFHTCSFTI